MPYEEARDRARFLTDKMAYELNLNEQQYNDAYEINLDYLMNIRTASDVSSVYLEYRNADMRFILYDWQYALFQAASYFFRPLVWRASGWFLPVYSMYNANRFYFSPPKAFRVYRGGHFHSWNGHRQSFYIHRHPTWRGGMRGRSRSPLPGHPVPPHRPVPHGGKGSPSFHFETPDRPTRPLQHPSARPGKGSRVDPTRRAGNDNRRHHSVNVQPGKTDNKNRNASGTAATRPATRPQSPSAKPRTSPKMQGVTQRRAQGNSRPSVSGTTRTAGRSSTIRRGRSGTGR